MRAASSALSNGIAEYSCSQTATHKASARNRNISIPCASQRASGGGGRGRPKIPSISTCGTIILSRPDAPDAERLASLPRLPRDDGGPVFAEPWQAQAFALAVKL